MNSDVREEALQVYCDLISFLMTILSDSCLYIQLPIVNAQILGILVSSDTTVELTILH